MSTLRETAEQIAEGWTHAEYHGVKLVDEIEKALRQVSNRVCDECESDLSDGSGFCATCDHFTMPSDFYLRWERRGEVDTAVRNERERGGEDCRLAHGPRRLVRLKR